MSYESVDRLQNVLANSIFAHTKDKKKAAGRALGTIVEVITFYLLKTWGFNNSIAIEKGLVEYGNSDISHNVEYSLHPVLNQYSFSIEYEEKSLTPTKIIKQLNKNHELSKQFDKNNNVLYTTNNVLRNACTIGESTNSYLVSSIESKEDDKIIINVFEQYKRPYAIFECKRVGVEEGNKKGPQTIEKAKQGAYVARTASSLQKIRNNLGEKFGIIYQRNNEPKIERYETLMEEIIYSDDTSYLNKFILSVGVVSNHGNWFTSENQNKELKVLSQSYDWLIFLSDKGLSTFISDLIQSNNYLVIKKTFENSYAQDKKENSFTKVKIDYDANIALLDYFSNNISDIENWFNVIGPNGKKISELKSEILELSGKNWKDIHECG